MMLKLRGGTAVFQIEMGRWYGAKREERVCEECDRGEVEDVGPGAYPGGCSGC